MLEKIKFRGPSIIASTLVFGFFFYVGTRIQAGEKMGGQRGIMRWIADGLNFLVEMFGANLMGYGIMAISLFFGVFAAVLIWRDKI